MKDRPILFGSLAAGLLASACCIGPLILGAIGVGSLGFGAWLAPARPWFLSLTAILLAIGFYLAYRPLRADACEAGEACDSPKSRRPHRIMLWSVTVVAVALATYPSWGARQSSPEARAAARGPSRASVALDVGGMTCEACAAEIEHSLREVAGVLHASVDYERSRADIVVGNEFRDPALLIAAVEKSGYRASVPAAQLADGSGRGPRLAGQWRGQLVVDEKGSTAELVVDLDQVAGRWTGQFDLPSFGVEDYPVDVALKGGTVTLQLTAAQVEFNGEFSGADTLVGMSETRGHRDSLVLRRIGKARLSPEFLRLEMVSEDTTRIERLSANGAELRRRFNADRSYTRLLMLLSPT